MSTFRSKPLALLTLVLWVMVGVLGFDHCDGPDDSASFAHTTEASADDHGCHERDGHAGPSDEHVAPLPSAAKHVFVASLSFALADFLPSHRLGGLLRISPPDPLLSLRPPALRAGTMCLRV